ncbi:MAG: transposase [Geobacter sp.]|nr:transposase [Geobacter sp.]
MARKPRIHFPAALYHVMLRGNAGQDIFFEDADRYRFYLLLQEGVERFGHRIHAYCLMSNHIHLAIQVGEVPLSRIMQNIAFRYTRWINWRRNSSGHLFQGRFKAVLVDGDSYVMELTRYIHLNPVRAGMVRSPEEYPWSGHRAYLGSESIPWLTSDWVLARKFVELGKDDGHRPEFHSGREVDSRLLGDDAFIERILEQTEGKPSRQITLKEIIATVCREYEISEKDFTTPGRCRYPSEARGTAARLILETGCGTIAELGKLTGRDPTTLSRVARHLQTKTTTDSSVAERWKKLLTELT